MTHPRLAPIALSVLVASACGTPPPSPDAGADAAATDVAVEAAARDVPVSTPDTSPSLPFGAACTTDADCASGLCAQSDGLVNGCAAPCQHDADCAALGTGDVFCAVDRPTAGAPRVLCAVSERGSGAGGTACTTNGQCIANECDAGFCRPPCATDADCTAGWRCSGYAVGAATLPICHASTISAPTVEDFVLFDGTASVDHGMDAVPVIAPADVLSMTFVAQDTEGHELFAATYSLQAPDGSAWINSGTWNIVHDQPVREILGITQVNSALAPSSDTLHVVPGRYLAAATLFNDTTTMTMVTSRHLRFTVRIKRVPATPYAGGTAHLRVFLVGAPGGIAAATAAGDARLASTIAGASAALGSQGVHLAVDGYADVAGADGTRLGTIDSTDEMDELLALSSSSTGDVLDLFVVHAISASAGLEGAIGVAGDIVGPPGLHGTTHSGVIVAWDTTLAGGHDLLPQTTGHELGHYLGLWHTREHLAPCTTTGQLNCSIFGGVDPISDTPNDDASASSYLMYWASSGTNLTVSPGEGTVLRASVLVR